MNSLILPDCLHIICYFIPTKKKGGATKIVIIMVMANTFLPDIEKSMK